MSSNTTSSDTIAKETQENGSQIPHNVALFLLVTCPVIAIVPPRKLDFYTAGLGVLWIGSANHIYRERSGKSFLGSFAKNKAYGDTGDAEKPPRFGLPTAKAAAVRERLAYEKDLKEAQKSLQKGDHKERHDRVRFGIDGDAGVVDDDVDIQEAFAKYDERLSDWHADHAKHRSHEIRRRHRHDRVRFNVDGDASIEDGSDSDEAAASQPGLMSDLKEEIKKKRREREERKKGILEKLWMGSEKEGWKERRLENERKALAEGKGYGSMITDQIWEVWNWGTKSPESPDSSTEVREDGNGGKADKE